MSFDSVLDFIEAIKVRKFNLNCFSTWVHVKLFLFADRSEILLFHSTCFAYGRTFPVFYFLFQLNSKSERREKCRRRVLDIWLHCCWMWMEIETVLLSFFGPQEEEDRVEDDWVSEESCRWTISESRPPHFASFSSSSFFNSSPFSELKVSRQFRSILPLLSLSNILRLFAHKRIIIATQTTTN